MSYNVTEVLNLNNKNNLILAKSRFSRLMGRLNFFNGLLSSSNRLPIAKVLGRKEYLTLDDLREKRSRSLAHRIINYFPEKTWSGKFEVYELDDPKIFTPFENDCKVVIEEFNLPDLFARLDSIGLLGRYSCLLLGIGTGKPNEQIDLSQPVKPNPNNKLFFIRPLAEDNCRIKSWITDRNLPNWGMPEYYELYDKDDSLNGSFLSDQTILGGSSKSSIKIGKPVPVHYSRIIHFVPIPFESEVYNDPPLLFPVYNYLEDLEKITGSSAEIFWRDAKKTKTFEAKEDYEIDQEVIIDLEKQVEEVEQGLKSFMVLEGLTSKELSSPVNKLNGSIDPLLDLIFGTLGITKRGFLGSDTGERASQEDAKTDEKKIKLRKERIGLPLIRRFFDILIKYQIIVPPKETNRINGKPIYNIEFLHENELSLAEKINVLDKLASANNNQSNVDGIGFTTVNEGRELILGFPPIELVSNDNGNDNGSGDNVDVSSENP